MMRYLSILSLLCFFSFFSSVAIAQNITFNSLDAAAGFAAFGAANGTIGIEDYVMDISALPDPSATEVTLTSMQFVGGVVSNDAGGGEIIFDFLDAGGAPLSAFAVGLPGDGNFIYTVPIPADFVIPVSGQVAITVDDAAAANTGRAVVGQWFLSTEINITNFVGSSPGNPFGLPPDGANPRVFALHLEADNVLPVELISFELSDYEKELQLDWITASEINNQGFEIQRSVDGKIFNRIGFVDGSGNTHETKNYSFSDDRILNNTNYYYRLKQMDYDGKYEFSNIVHGMIKGTDQLSIGDFIPNPASGSSMINVSVGSKEEISVVMFGPEGKQIKNDKFLLEQGTHGIELDLSDVASGGYFVKISTSTETTIKRLIIE